MSASDSPPSEPQRLLLGGVPFGENNIGDEAIAQTIIETIRSIDSSIEITLATSDPDSAERLRVKSCPLLGFEGSGKSSRTVAKHFARHDKFLWGGATGLSDYPDIPVGLLERAQAKGMPTAVFCTGMNSELNPYLYKLKDGTKRRLLHTGSRILAGSVNLPNWYDLKKQAPVRRRIGSALAHCGKVIVRDPESKEQVLACRSDLDVTVGADPVIELAPKPDRNFSIEEKARLALRSQRPKIGMCFSAQRPMLEREKLLEWINELLLETNAAFFGLPMNPVTDKKWLEDCRGDIVRPEHFHIIDNIIEPDEVAGLAAAMDVLVSSRLHLLIFGSLSHVPMVAIGRGSKLANYIKPYGLKTAGNTEKVDIRHLNNEVRRFLDPATRRGYGVTSRRVMQTMKDRYVTAKAALAEFLAK